MWATRYLACVTTSTTTSTTPRLATSDIYALKIEAGAAGDGALVDCCLAALEGGQEALATVTSVVFDAVDAASLDLSGVRKVADALGLVWAWADHGDLCITAGAWRVRVATTDDGVVCWGAEHGAEHDEDGNWTCVADVVTTLTSLAAASGTATYDEDDDDDDDDDTLTFTEILSAEAGWERLDDTTVRYGGLTIYWDSQDSTDEGWAYRLLIGGTEESGVVDCYEDVIGLLRLVAEDQLAAG